MGYAQQTPYRTDVSSISIPIFVNDTFVRDIEFELTDAVIKAIQARTPYMVTSQTTADTVLLGHVRKVELDQLSKSRLTGLSEEVIVSVTIDFQWKDLRNDRVLVERAEFSGHGLFVPSQPTAEPIELGRMAAVEQLAHDIVAELRSEW